ncbi:hypothetical protein, partial [Nocardia amamiensis]|uniref:hypothetical protein n=1 Tax=Nocardia amamiensis TaxID=404578 RepID=UPI000A88D529
VSGDRPQALMEQQQDQFAFYDGGIADPSHLGVGADVTLVPLVSGSWSTIFTWTGEAEMPAAERDKLHNIVDQAHAAGQRVRFWATPDAPGARREAVWRELVAADVDHISTDDLAGLEAFLREQ